MGYIGKPAGAAFTETVKDSFNGDNSTVAFTMSQSVSLDTDIEVFVGNVQQEPGSGKAYTVSGTTLTFSEAPPTGTANIYVIHRNSLQGTLLPPQNLGDRNYLIGGNLSLDADSAALKFGVDSEITVTHVADTGLNIKHTATGDDKPVVLTLQTGETDIQQDDVLGTINFQAPDEGTGTDAILVAAGIAAVSEGDFSSSSNATKLSFKTGSSEAASEKMSLSSAGILTVSDDIVIKSSGTIGGANDTDLLTLGNAALTVAGTIAGTAITASGILKTDDTTEATSTTDGSLQTDGGLSVAKDIVAGDDIKLLSDSASIFFGADSEIELRHVADDGLILKHIGTGDGKEPSLTFQAGDNDIAQDDVLGSIFFQAPDEGAGTDAILVAAGIEAVSEGDFSASSNATSLVFKTGASEAATTKMILTSLGQLKVQNEVDNNYIAEFQNTEATDGRSFGMRIKAGSTSADQSFVIQDHDASNTLFKITGDGDVNIGIGDILFGTSGKGINLGVTSNTDSNTLDDYEEGTWSGTLRAVAGSAGTVAGNTSTAHYLKVGNAINILFTCSLTNLGSYTANANVAVYGLPFTAGGYINHPLTLGFHDFHSNSTTRNICVQVTANQAYVYHANPDSSITLWNEIGTGLYAFNGFYRTDF